MTLAASGQATEVKEVFREAYGQAVSTLVRVFGDITLAEDAVQEAFVTASDRWPRDGIPPMAGPKRARVVMHGQDG